MILAVCGRSTCHWPRISTAAGIASITAATATRTDAAAAGDQPASIRDLPSAPDVLKAAEENTARPNPARAPAGWRISAIPPSGWNVISQSTLQSLH